MDFDYVQRPVPMDHGFFFEPPKDFEKQLSLNGKYPIERHFSDREDFIRYVDQKNKYRNANNSDKDLKAALKYFKDGWPAGADAIAKYHVELNEQLGQAAKSKAPSYAVAGDTVDVSRYLMGEPECMQTTGMSHKGKRFVRIVVNTTFNCGYTETNMIRGAVVCAMSDAIERAGWQSEIIAASGVACDNNKMPWSLFVPIKQVNEPLSLELVSFPIMSGAWDRAIIFRCQEQEQPPLQDHCVAKAGGYYGARDVAPEHRGDIYFSAMNQANFNNFESGADFAFAELAKMGIKLDH